MTEEQPKKKSSLLILMTLFIVVGLLLAFMFFRGKAIGGKEVCFNTGRHLEQPMYLHEDYRCEPIPRQQVPAINGLAEGIGMAFANGTCWKGPVLVNCTTGEPVA